MAWRWRKLGLIFRPEDAGVPWMVSHAAVPVAEFVEGDVYRVYFATRTEDQVARIGYVLVDVGGHPRVLHVGVDPVLEPGGIGTFDEHGVIPSCILEHGGQKWLYYIGWNRGARRPLFYASIGLARCVDGKSGFEKLSTAPLMSRGPHDPCLVTLPHVTRYGDRLRMTYTSGIRWTESGGALQSHYHIKYAESGDGIDWRRDGAVAVDFAGSEETNIARSWVVEDEGVLRMWFCYVRGESGYRIGYAESYDYLRWTRNDSLAGIDVSPSGVDSAMIAYPNVVRHCGRMFMFYNGNAFGKDGFCLAVME